MRRWCRRASATVPARSVVRAVQRRDIRAPSADGPRLELSRSVLSPDGSRIAAWQGMIPAGEPAPLCVVHLSSRTAVCAALHSRDQLQDSPRFSSRGTYLAMRTRGGLSVRETARLHPVFEKDLGKDEQLVAFAPSPNERLIAWVDARGAARVLDITTRDEVMSSPLGGSLAAAQVLWSGDDRVVFAAQGQAPQVWDLAQRSVNHVDVPGAAWRGYEVAVHGNAGVVAGRDELVAWFDARTGLVTTLLRPPMQGSGHRSVEVSSSQSGARIAVTLGERVDVFDASPPALLVSTRVIDGQLTRAALSPDGSRMGLGVDRISFDEGLTYESHTFPVATAASPRRTAEGLFLGWVGATLVTAQGTEVVGFDGDTMAWRYDTGFVWAEASMLGRYCVSGGTAIRLFDTSRKKSFELEIIGPTGSPRLSALHGTSLEDLPRSLLNTN